jgi:hypothetical protein
VAINKFEDTDELVEFLEHLVGDRNPVTLTSNILLGYLNQAHLDVVNGGGLLNTTGAGTQKTSARQWSWLPTTEEILEVPPYEEGTITITNGSASATLDSSPADSKTGWYLYFDNSVYKVSAHTAATATVTLDSDCASESGDFQYKLYKLDFTLSTASVMRLFDEPFRMSPSPEQIQVVSADSISDFERYRSPRHALLERVSVDFSTADAVSVQLSTIYNKTQRIKFKFVTTPADLDPAGTNPILPARHRKLLAHYAAFMHLEKRDDSRAQAQLAIARQQFEALVDEQDRKLSQQGKSMFARARLFQARTRFGAGFAWLKRRV